MLIILVGCIAAGCGGIPLPEKPEQYATWVEEGESMDLIHVQFDILFDTKGASETDILGQLNKCSADGSCGMMARLAEDDAFRKENFSCACELTIKGAVSVDENGDGKMENRQKVVADCIVPVDKGVLFYGSKVYKLMVTSVSPNSQAGTELAFTSSPRFEVKEGSQIKSLKGNFQLAFN
jgi:hypothetical protein